jgi:Flp pilus assembly protein TadD
MSPQFVKVGRARIALVARRVLLSFYRLVRRQPADAAGWVWLATTLAAVEDWDRLRAEAARLRAAAPDAVEPWRAFGQALIKAGDWMSAEPLVRKACDLNPGGKEAKRSLAHVLMELGRAQEAALLFRELAFRDDAQPEDWVSLGHAASAIGDGRTSSRAFRVAILNYIEQVARQRGLVEIAQRSQRLGERGARAERVAALSHRPPTPPILVVTLPKSGSIYLHRALRDGLGKREIPHNVAGRLPQVGIELTALSRLIGAHGIIVAHYSPSHPNIVEIGARLDRMVVHVRDPRQAMISWCHFLPAYAGGTDPAEATLYGLPEGFITWDQSAQLDWLIDHHFALWVDWIQGWHQATAEDRLSTRVLFTRHEDLVADRSKFFERILQFYEIDPTLFKAPPLPHRGESNFRSGETQEWRRVMTPAQQARVNALLPPALADVFDWPRC